MIAAMCEDRETCEEITALQDVLRQLVERNSELEAEKALLQERIAELERKADTPSASASPRQFKSNRTPRAKDAPRKKRAHNFARKRATPTRRVVHAIDRCRRCGCTLRGGSVKRTREVLHIPLAPAEVIEHVFVERECPLCGQHEVPDAEVLAGEVIGQCRVSVQTMALIATLREVGRLPVATIQWLLDTVHGLHLSRGELVEILHTVAERAEKSVARLKEELGTSPVVHGDETTWREDGQNGYFWTFCTPTMRYFTHRRSRSGDVVLETLGEDFGGVLVTDFYAGYSRLLGQHQRCWAHLLRAVHELGEKYPEDEQLHTWGKAVHALYEKACQYAEEHPDASAKERTGAQHQFEQKLMDLCRPHLSRDAPQTVLCQRVERFQQELFVFVADPRVPPTNNAAERAIRPLAVSRKISGGTRSPWGTATKGVLASIFSTWTLRSLNPFSACRELLLSPQV
jgi:transposase